MLPSIKRGFIRVNFMPSRFWSCRFAEQALVLVSHAIIVVAMFALNAWDSYSEFMKNGVPSFVFQGIGGKLLLELVRVFFSVHFLRPLNSAVTGQGNSIISIDHVTGRTPCRAVISGSVRGGRLHVASKAFFFEKIINQ